MLNIDKFNELQTMKTQWSPLLSEPGWYLTVIPQILAFTKSLQAESSSTRSACKESLYDFFEQHLKVDDLCLGDGSGQFDRERKPIDTVVIHHTSQPPGLSAGRLSAIELMRLYGPYFATPPEAEMKLRGQPIFSGHQRRGKQVFWPYHWIVRSNGRPERLLSDGEVGWHAGNWDINCRSVGIALDSDYETSRPTEVVLRAVAGLIAIHYGGVPVAQVLGHSEVNLKTVCPSKLFLTTSSGDGWKKALIRHVLDHQHSRAA